MCLINEDFTSEMVSKFKKIANSICYSYAAILFTADSRIGLMFLLVTFWYPNIGSAGLVSALIAVATEKLFRFRNLGGNLHIYNSLLVGLGLGATYQLDGHLLLLIFFASVTSVFFSVVLSEWLWRAERLPALSLPFVLVTFIYTLSAQSYVNLQHYVHPVPSNEVFLSVPIDYFLMALGATFITPVPAAGLLLFLGIFITSRYLALLAISGFIAGNTVFGLLSDTWYSALGMGIGFNFILTAVAVGGIFTIPSKQ
ncbi:MAG: urea transporter, partial [Methylococcales bacterium]|nr:urea transporter [Methylococcales bacterium]